MVAIVTGNGLGIVRSSALVLGSRGQLGDASLGRAGENVFLNAATGNLVVSNRDEMLIGLGPDSIFSRTYNSLGALNDDNGDNWRESVQRKVAGLTGTVNTAGSTITLTDWDGSDTTFTWDSTRSAYISKEGAGAYDTLTYASSVWTWKDGNSRQTETFDDANGGRITSSSDVDGNALSFTYTSGQLTRVTSQNGEYTDLTWSGSNLTQLATYRHPDTAGSATMTAVTRVRYGYDGSNRLTSVTVDLSPTDNTVADNVKYVTTYTYDGTSKRVASITQTDGSSLAIHYDGSNRVDQLTQTSASGVTRVTGISYGAGTTTVTDPAGQATVLSYDASKQLTQIQEPAPVSGGSAITTQFAYDSNGNVTSVTDGLSHVTTYGYDGNGNQVWARDALGNEVTRTFGSNNELLTETHWTGVDPDAGGTGSSPTGAMTVRYAYDSENHLRYAISAEGNVTEFVYNAAGQSTATVVYVGAPYTLTGLSDTTSISEATLDSWRPSDKSSTQRTDRTYDFRGNLATEVTYNTTLTSGAGDTSGLVTTVSYIYDQAGNLLQRTVGSSSEVFVFDGLNRITSSTDFNGVGTTIVFNDASSTTAVTVAGLTKTSTYNLAGELISYAESGSGVTTATTSYAYDNMGRLRRVTDPTGVKTWFLYDRDGRKVADIQADGSIIEYGYDAADRLIRTTAYKTLVTSTLLTQLDGNIANQTYELSAYRPSSDAADVWTWKIYDNADRLIETIDGAGAATVVAYDAASRLVSTTQYANLIASGTVTGYKTTAPTTLQTPTADASNDRVSRVFYDNDGRAVGTLDAEGYLTKNVYDAAGQLIETVAYSGATSTTYRASGTFAQLLGSVTPDTSKDIHNWSLYDKQGRLRATINGEGDLTRYEYSGLGYRTKEIRGQKTTVSTWLTTAPTLATLPTPGSDVLDTTQWTYDLYGHVASEVRTLASGSETDTYSWGVVAGDYKLLSKTTVSGTANARTTTYRYDLRGRLTGELSGEGSAVLTPPPTTAYDGYQPGTTGADTLTGTSGRDLLQGQSGNDTLSGLGGDDRLEGGPGIDTILGGDGNDIINSGSGNDITLTGGNGRDIFVFASGDGTDTITDFQIGVDLIDLRALGGYTSLTTSGSDVVVNLSGGGTITVKNVTTSALTASHFLFTDADVYSAFGTTYTYDLSDRLIARTDPDGSGKTGLKTLYYYDTDGHLRFEINALGEVKEYRFDNLGRLSDTVVYGTRIGASTLATLTGGLVDSTLTTAITGITNSSLDSTSSLAYNVTGTVSQATDALGAVTSFAYSAFGQLVSETDPIDTSTTVAKTFTYDRKGLLKTSTVDAIGLNNLTQVTYDAFGRAVSTTDALGIVRNTGFDRAGRTVSTAIDPTGLNLTASYSYDGRGHVVSMTDQAGATTTYSFDAFDRNLSVVVTAASGETITTSSVMDAYGRAISVTDGAGRTTSFRYDRDGRVEGQSDAQGNTVTTDYDTAGRVVTVTDARGVKTVFTYDAANRVLTQKVDSGGLNLTTSYQYDAKGQAVQVTDPAGTVTTVAFDKKGRKTSVVVDPGAGHLALTTSWTYDKRDRVLTVTDASGVVTQNTYDKGDRLTQTVVDPGTSPHLALTTSYAYDKNGNATARTDANGKITRFVYDANNRLIWSVDAVGAVVKTDYDGMGRVITTRAYANQVASATLAGWGTAITAANITGAVSTSSNDEVTNSVYDGAGRLRFVIDATGHATAYVYDGAGNVLHTTTVAATVSPASYSFATVKTAVDAAYNATNDRTTRGVYDNANRLTYSIDALGYVTAYTYDAAGNVVKTRQYETAYGVSGDQTKATLDTWSSGLTGTSIDDDRISRALYDNAGRQVYAVDPLGYVTETQYDAAGRVTKTIRYAAAYTVGDSDTATTVKALLPGTPPTTAAVTTYTYDLAGRLTDTMNALGYVTHLVLDAMGRATDIKVAYGTADEAVTHQTFDAAGRMLTQARGYGASEVSTTAWTYDGLGRVLTVTRGSGTSDASTITYTYDAVGNLATEAVDAAGLNLVTTNTYDAFGNKVKVTDPRGNAGYFYFDKLNRLTLQVSPEGYAVETGYSLAGQVVSVKRCATQCTGSLTVGTPPTLTTSGSDATTTITRDKLEQVTGTTDAVGASETYTLNAFGDRVSVTNKLGGVTTNIFDKRGMLIEERLPVSSYTTSGTAQTNSITSTAIIINRYSYDARGNKTQMIEAAGLTEARTTNYAYDLLDRLTTTTHDAVSTADPSNPAASPGSATPSETIAYDRRGNVVETTDAAGARTVYYYDKLDRKKAQVDALGDYTVWTYNVRDDALTQRTYGDALTMGGVAASTLPTAVNSANYRETTFTWDKADRQLTVSTAGLLTGSWNGTNYTTTTGTVTTTTTYDANGNVIQVTDGRGNSVYTYYDKANRKVAQVDQEKYLTSWTLDADGNVTSETRFSNTTGGTISTSTTVATLLANTTASSTNDRTTQFTYDKNGRRLTEKRLNLVAYTVSGTGVLASDSTGFSLITYTYNGLDEVTSKTEANGDATTYTYDVMGRQTKVTAQGYTDYAAASVSPTTDLFYDGLNNVSRTREGKASADGAIDRVTTYTYGAGGRLSSVTDGTGFVRSYGYDAAGRVTKESYTRTKSGGTTETDATVHGYDLLGREIYQASGVISGSTWTAGDVTRTQYDVFGEMTARGIGTASTAMYQETFSYDAGGRMWRSNGGDGSVKLFFYDAGGAVTLTLNSSGTDLSSYTSASAALTALTSSGANPIGSVALTGVVATINVLDKRGLTTSVREPFRELRYNATAPSTIDTATVIHSKTYNAFGEVASETDANSHTTSYSYNTLGKMTQKVMPTTSWTSESGAVTTGYAPTESYGYDLSGRLVAVTDANGNVTRRLLLAGTGHGEDEAKVTTEFHADNYSTVVGFDVFGDERKFTNELSYVETRDYDMAGRLITLTRPSRGSGTPGGAVTGLVEHYTYDGLGQRLTHWNSQLGSSVKETTDYDAQGRVVSSVDFAGHATTFGFSFSTTLATTGLGTFGGWTKTVTNTSGLTSTTKVDYFQHTVDQVDFGSHDFDFTYDVAGRLLTQSNTGGQLLNYTYFNTGRVAKMIDGVQDWGMEGGSANTGYTSTYGYDAQGNRIVETYKYNEYGWQWVPDPGYELVFDIDHGHWDAYQWSNSLQSAAATFDELNRLKTVTDSGDGATRPISVAYEYDKVGNVRRVNTTYESVITNGNIGQDFWYKYDSMNRMVLAKGALSGGSIVRSTTGTDLTYDAAGQRASATETLSGVTHVENFIYSEDGYLVKVTSSDAGGSTVQRGIDIRDAMGRVTSHTEYKSDGTTVAYSRTATYASNGDLTGDVVSVLDTDGATTISTTTYGYNAETSWNSGVFTGAYMGGQAVKVDTEVHRIGTGGAYVERPDTLTVNSYVWFDSAKQYQTRYDSDTGSSTNAIWNTTLSYDSNGHIYFANIADGRPRTVTYMTDATGQVMSRKESSTATNNPIELYYYYNGMRIGDVGNDGPSDSDYAGVINKRNYSQSGPFRSNSGRVEFADFDQAYDAINPNSDRQSGSSYAVQDGDTLQSIASSVYGDANLWYLIADANGLDAGSSLLAGMSISIPAKVSNVHNNSSTFRPYDPNEAIGNVSPTRPKPVKGAHCGPAQILVAIIAAVVVALVAPYATAAMSNAMFGTSLAGADVAAAFASGSTMVSSTLVTAEGLTVTVGTHLAAAALVAGGAIAGAVGSIVSQGVGMAIGAQDKFSWNAVGMAAIGGGVSGGMLKLGPSAGIVKSAIRGGESNIITQGVGIATGLQRRFDWTAVAAAGVGGAVSFKVQGATAGLGKAASSAISGLAGGLANAATRSVVDGGDFGDNLIAALPDIIGSTIGGLIADQVTVAIADGSDDAHLTRMSSNQAADKGAYSSGGSAVGGYDSTVSYDWNPDPTARVGKYQEDYNQYLMGGSAATPQKAGFSWLWKKIGGLIDTTLHPSKWFKGSQDYRTSTLTSTPQASDDNTVAELVVTARNRGFFDDLIHGRFGLLGGDLSRFWQKHLGDMEQASRDAWPGEGGPLGPSVVDIQLTNAANSKFSEIWNNIESSNLNSEFNFSNIRDRWLGIEPDESTSIIGGGRMEIRRDSTFTADVAALPGQIFDSEGAMGTSTAKIVFTGLSKLPGFDQIHVDEPITIPDLFNTASFGLQLVGPWEGAATRGATISAADDGLVVGMRGSSRFVEPPEGPLPRPSEPLLKREEMPYPESSPEMRAGYQTLSRKLDTFDSGIPNDVWTLTPQQLERRFQQEGYTTSLRPPRPGSRAVVFDVIGNPDIKRVQFNISGGLHGPGAPYWKFDMTDGTQVRVIDPRTNYHPGGTLSSNVRVYGTAGEPLTWQPKTNNYPSRWVVKK